LARFANATWRIYLTAEAAAPPTCLNIARALLAAIAFSLLVPLEKTLDCPPPWGPSPLLQSTPDEGGEGAEARGRKVLFTEAFLPFSYYLHPPHSGGSRRQGPKRLREPKGGDGEGKGKKGERRYTGVLVSLSLSLSPSFILFCGTFTIFLSFPMSLSYCLRMSCVLL